MVKYFLIFLFINPLLLFSQEVSTGEIYPIAVLPIKNTDYKSLSKARYFFDWKGERKEEVCKVVMKGQNDILGLISIERIPSEYGVHIRLLTASKENVGNGKAFDKVAGNLIADAAKIAVTDYGALACVSLRPKSLIAHHYIRKYNMNLTGITLSLEVPEIIDLINHYDHD